MTTAAAERARAYLDYLLTYPAGIPTIRRAYGYPLHPFELRTLLADAGELTEMAATHVEDFLAAFARTGEDTVDVRPSDDDPQHVLTVADITEVLTAARRRQADRMLIVASASTSAAGRAQVQELLVAGLTAKRLHARLADAEGTIRRAQELTGAYVGTGGEAHEVIQADRILRGLAPYAG